MPLSSLLAQHASEAIHSIAVEQIDADSPLFDQVLDLRAEAYGRDLAGEREAIDDYSLHFAALARDKVVGALRVTCRKHGPLESQQFYPDWLLDEFGDRLCAASRMCVQPGSKGASLPIALTTYAWKTVLPLGIRIDVSKARLELVPYYMRMGYAFLRNSVFAFDRWNVRCGLIAFPANANHPSKFATLFSRIDAPCDLRASLHAHEFVTTLPEFFAATEEAA